MFFTFLLLFVVHNIAIIYVLKLPISQITTATYCLLCQKILSILQPQHSDFCRQRTIVIALPHFRFW